MVPQFDLLRHTEIGSVIEYAVKSLQVDNILIMGHSRCGGIKRLMSLPDQTQTYDFIDEWVKIGLPAKKKVLEEAGDLPTEQQLTLCEKESVKNSMGNLLTYPFVRRAVVNGTLTLRGAYYDFVNGNFEQWQIVQEELDEKVQSKVEKLIAELQGREHHHHHPHPHHPPCDHDAQRLDDGFHFFKTNIFEYVYNSQFTSRITHQRLITLISAFKNRECFKKLAEAQHPKFLVFSCSDSRVSPSVVLNFKPGEAFVGRNIANMVPQFDQLRHIEIGSVIEYAVKSLQVDNILIMGHSRCGGIERLMSLPDHTQTYDFIDEWVKIGLPAKKKVLEEAGNLPPEQQLTLCEKESVKNSMGNLLTYPFVRSAVVNGTLTLRGGYYDFVNGDFKQWKIL
ncbi:carbonic anhydrase 2-like [Gossypium australe]|uniref:carbonic anhydrase n=1 Tax=Gossypium australe TaxID=47621 RepID=A0A5B6UNQ1_9ROSI|nr:carbonic anhydrase 2-like [Gossypium australe]